MNWGRGLVAAVCEGRLLSCSLLPSSPPSLLACHQSLSSLASEKNVVKSPYSDVVIPDLSVPKFIWKDYKKWPDAQALVCGVSGRSYTYREGRDLSRKFGMGFGSAGLRPGHVLSLVLPNSPEYPLITLGAQEAGIIVSPANPLYTVDEIVNQLRNSGSVGVVTIPEHLKNVLEAQAKLGSFNKHQAETLKVFIAPGIRDMGDSNLPSRVIPLMDLVKENEDTQNLEANMAVSVSCDDIAHLPYSSGTTGLPKGVCLTHKNIVANLSQLSHPEVVDISTPSQGNQEVLPLVLPMYHMYGLLVGAFRSLLHGVKVVTLPKFEEEIFLRTLKDHQATRILVAPPLVLYMGNSPKVTEDHLKSIRSITTGAAPVGEWDIKKCLGKTQKSSIFIQGYGLTESSAVSCVTRLQGSKYNSAGCPLPNTYAKIIDISTGEPLPAHKTGELCIKGPQIMKCYLNNEEATSEVFDRNGWLHTGDIAYYDEDSNFYVVDRMKELIKVKGFQVSPSELEELLRSHPSVLDAGVIGMEDERKGEVPIGFIVLKPGEKISADALKVFLKEKVAPFKQIERFEFVTSIPKSSAGKILRRELKANPQTSKH